MQEYIWEAVFLEEKQKQDRREKPFELNKLRDLLIFKLTCINPTWW